MGFVSEGAMGEILSKSMGTQEISLESIIIDSRLVRKIPKEFAIKNKLVAVSYAKGSVTIAMIDIFDIIAIDKVKKYFPPNFNINTVYASESYIMQIIDQYYDYAMSIEGILKEIEGGDTDYNAESGDDYKSPVVRLVDVILSDAVHKGASDIHLEPEESFLRIRYRIDGVMVQIRSIHKEYWNSMAVRIKIISNMNIAENRKAQDGRIESNILGRKIDFRVSSQPTVNGENIVMRILDEKGSILSLDKCGFSEHNIKVMKKIIKKDLKVS